MLDSTTLFIAFLGGVLPALLWLVFWQLEDRCEPEPKLLILLTFIAGMAVVPLVLPIQFWARAHFTGGMMLFIWALAEELLKFGAAWLVAFRHRALDEPIDAIIYMVTAALGFAAAENALFLIDPLTANNTLASLVTGNVRFIGATLLHTLASGTIGIAFALAFYRSRSVRSFYTLIGVILSVVLHTLFNFFILFKGGSATVSVFLCVWVGIILLLLFFERLKHPSRDYC